MALIEMDFAGGGSADNEVLLYEDLTSVNVVNPVTLSDEPSNYESLKIVFCMDSTVHPNEDEWITMIIPVKMLPVGTGFTAGDSPGPMNYRGSAYHARYQFINSNNTKQLASAVPSSQTAATNWIVRRVYGIK